MIATPANRLRTWAPTYSSGALSLLKWLALLLMVVDHVEAFWFQRSFDSQLGRLVFPIFAFVIGYNLARPGVDRVGLIFRLATFGLLAAVPHAILVGGWFPFNVMWTFAAAVLVVHLLDSDNPWKIGAACSVFVVAGAFVEYWWPGIALVVGVVMFFRPGVARVWWPVAVPLLAVCALQVSLVPLLAVPLVVVARHATFDLPRLKWAFYVFYPAHLAAFVLLGAPGLRG